MHWKQPQAFWFLLALAVLIWSYMWLWRRSARAAVRFPAIVLGDAAPAGNRFTRHLSAACFACALAWVIMATARPVVPWPIPTGWPVVLIIDVSRSMEENDIPPTRLEAAKSAALEFVQALPRFTRIALVSFGNYATVIVPLTTDRERMADGLRGLRTQLRTQLGTGLSVGVQAVTGEAPPPAAAEPVRAVAVLLSDGRASDGIPPLEAAQEARREAVRVYTVGVGTANDPSSFRSGYWGVLDEPTLRAIAAQTGGQYYHAADGRHLSAVYRDLARTVGWTREPTEVSAFPAALALVWLGVALTLQFRLHRIA